MKRVIKGVFAIMVMVAFSATAFGAGVELSAVKSAEDLKLVEKRTFVGQKEFNETKVMKRTEQIK